ncbi:MAG TPA: hypothetical protein VNG90_01985 [Candidatus Acidoferrum sp.]|nr:hypothetical protein [Candidatus Acidoferrum sp.]
MDNEIEKPKHVAHPKGAHDSNPFTTVITGIEKLFTYNASSLTAYIFFSAAAGIVMVFTIMALVVAGIAFIQQNASFNWVDTSALIIPQIQLGGFFGTMTTATVYTTWIIGLPLLVVLCLLLHISAIKLALLSSAKKTVGLGDVLKQSLKRIIPALGLIGIVIGVMLAAFILLGTLTHILGPIGFVLIIIAVLAFVYIGLRCTFAWLSLVNGAGPIAALEDSWSLTYGHIAETVGIVAASASVVMVPLLLLNTLAATGDGTFAGIISIISLLAALVSAVIIAVAYAERFMQLRHIQEGSLQASPTHPFNYLAVLILVIILTMSGLAPHNNQTFMPTPRCPIYDMHGLQPNSSCLPIQPTPYSAQ